MLCDLQIFASEQIASVLSGGVRIERLRIRPGGPFLSLTVLLERVVPRLCWILNSLQAMMSLCFSALKAFSSCKLS